MGIAPPAITRPTSSGSAPALSLFALPILPARSTGCSGATRFYALFLAAECFKEVKEGDSVKIGSSILVLEAMKMQNEIVSNTDGVVREIRVSEGDLVESKDVLVVIGN